MTEEVPPSPPPATPSPPSDAGPGTPGPPPGAGPGGAAPGATGPASPPGEPPPLTALAWRYRLVRPKQGRMLAGVCGAIGRATNTDPVLWRVVLVVLTIFAGIGALAYLIAWLLLPADGDTASPVEALAGRGRSGTSTVLTIIGGVIVLFALAAYLSEPFRAAPLLVVVLLGGALLLLLRDRGRAQAAGAAGAAPIWSPPVATGATAGPGVPAGGVAASSAEAPTLGGTTSVSGATTGATSPPSPFAPHGPFAPATAGGYPPPPPPVFPPPRPPRPPKERSRLGLLTFSLLLVVVGGIALMDLAGLNIRPAAYLAAGLATVGAGLVLGTWFGRARGLIALGIVLTLALGSMFGVDRFDGWRQAGTMVWTPQSVAQVQDTYEHGIGDAVLDLTAVDFTEVSRPVQISVSLDLGNLAIRLPEDVDVVIESNVDVGNADVFDSSRGGLDPGQQTITDYGRDGPGGGQVHINANVDLGNLEVTR